MAAARGAGLGQAFAFGHVASESGLFLTRKIKESVNQLAPYSRKWLVVLNVLNLGFSLF